MAGGYIWYELITPDPDAAARFYGAVVGWRIVGHSDPAAGGMDYRMIERSDGGNAGGVLKLTAEMQQGGARPCWLGYLHVEDVDAAVAAITADGGQVRMPATSIEVGRIAMVTDPQGAPFYVMKPVPPAGKEDMASDVFAPMDAQHVRWNELSTSDPEAAITFYRRHFGWTQEGEMDMGAMGKYSFIQHDGVGIGAVMRKPEQVPVSLWTYYVGVDDIDASVRAIEAGGGRVVHGPMEIPGGEFSLNGIDPQGAHFGLVGPRKG
jgi:predicted enzyme related to lactoylglutathione lyase